MIDPTQSARIDNIETKANTVSALASRSFIANGNLSSWTSGPGPFTSVSGAFNYNADNFASYVTASTVTTSREAQSFGAFLGESQYFRRTVVTTAGTASSYANINYSIQDVRTLAAKTVTLSFWARASAASKFMSVEFTQTFGSGGTPSAEVSGIGVQKIALSTSWQRYSITATLPFYFGKTLGTNNDSTLDINVWLDAGSNFNTRTASLGNQSITFDDWGWQLEEGSQASDFKSVPVPAFARFGGQTPGPWQNFVPTWTTNAVGIQPTLGNGSLTGIWRYAGPKTIDVDWALTIGTSTTFGSGVWRLSLPAGLSSSLQVQAGTAFTGQGGPTMGACWVSGAGYIEMGSTGGYWQAGIPFNWAAGVVVWASIRGVKLT